MPRVSPLMWGFLAIALLVAAMAVGMTGFIPWEVLGLALIMVVVVGLVFRPHSPAPTSPATPNFSQMTTDELRVIYHHLRDELADLAGPELAATYLAALPQDVHQFRTEFLEHKFRIFSHAANGSARFAQGSMKFAAQSV